jgi:hypothetical protein
LYRIKVNQNNLVYDELLVDSKLIKKFYHSVLLEYQIQFFLLVIICLYKTMVYHSSHISKLLFVNEKLLDYFIFKKNIVYMFLMAGVPNNV